MTIKKSAQTTWSGDIKSGKGYISTQSDALKDQPFGFNTRFEDKPGTNPEELIGAALSSCFSMALSLTLGEDGFEADSINTKAVVSLDEVKEGFEVSHIALTVEAAVPELSDEKFQVMCQQTKKDCPISKLMKADISLQARLLSR